MATAKVRIGFQGIPGALTEGAIQSLYQIHGRPAFGGHGLDIVPFETIDQLFQALYDHGIDHLLIPIETTQSGTIHSTMDRLISARPPLYMTGEFIYSEPYCLLAPAGTRLADIREIHSHSSVLEQCHRFITQGLPQSPHIVCVQAASTASGARRVAELARHDRLSLLHHMRLVDGPRLPTTSYTQHGVRPTSVDVSYRAAIAGASAARLYHLEVLDTSSSSGSGPRNSRANRTGTGSEVGVGTTGSGSGSPTHPSFPLGPADQSHQALTRYALVSPQPVEPERHQDPKTSLAITVANRSGSLFKVLGCFALRDINVCKLESRPSRRSSRRSRLSAPWEYVIYVDVDGSENIDDPVRHAIANLREFADKVQVLGCYPRYTPLD
ncbi:hypothetical protein H4R33_004459 [Dimargaris cristalligena]|uniref:prephenate dehydratase n=1 Tax=Dimargaris cristalligena TaxID=215637 RepID=A0A4P9ZRJ9_9FUNG|nr:hypothetical protein H4R33_004459 [Dimargaris cristalligena]RKP35985.1 Prephenate dehydratase-domain-containing protein [Dimargaris cristalligena]|eukprot:RKP35985.1 Prephenate dehydratase-domain-containing protein [Dimargaris cristalligena]